MFLTISIFTLMKILNLINATSLEGKPLIVALQGLTYSDRTTFGNYLEEILESHNINVMRIKINSYYKSVRNDLETLRNYDFNNPAAIDWDLMKRTLYDLAKRNDRVQLSTFDKSCCISRSFMIQNTYPDVIILDGKFALNFFNDKIFNVAEFDCMKSSTQIVKKEYIENPDDFYKYFRIMKVLFQIERDDAFNIRCNESIGKEGNGLSRDQFEVNVFKDLSHHFVEKFWPSTLRWVHSALQPDFVFVKNEKIPEPYFNIVDKVFSVLNPSFSWSTKKEK